MIQKVIVQKGKGNLRSSDLSNRYSNFSNSNEEFPANSETEFGMKYTSDFEEKQEQTEKEKDLTNIRIFYSIKPTTMNKELYIKMKHYELFYDINKYIREQEKVFKETISNNEKVKTNCKILNFVGKFIHLPLFINIDQNSIENYLVPYKYQKYKNESLNLHKNLSNREEIEDQNNNLEVRLMLSNSIDKPLEYFLGLLAMQLSDKYLIIHQVNSEDKNKNGIELNKDKSEDYFEKNPEKFLLGCDHYINIKDLNAFVYKKPLSNLKTNQDKKYVLYVYNSYQKEFEFTRNNIFPFIKNSKKNSKKEKHISRKKNIKTEIGQSPEFNIQYFDNFENEEFIHNYYHELICIIPQLIYNPEINSCKDSIDYESSYEQIIIDNFYKLIKDFEICLKNELKAFSNKKHDFSFEIDNEGYQNLMDRINSRKIRVFMENNTFSGFYIKYDDKINPFRAFHLEFSFLLFNASIMNDILISIIKKTSQNQFFKIVNIPYQSLKPHKKNIICKFHLANQNILKVINLITNSIPQLIFDQKIDLIKKRSLKYLFFWIQRRGNYIVKINEQKKSIHIFENSKIVVDRSNIKREILSLISLIPKEQLYLITFP